MKILAAMLLAATSFSVSALDNAQITALRTFALSDGTAVTCMNAGDDNCLFTYLNSQSDFIVWKRNVTQDSITTSPEFNWTRVDNLTNGKARIWQFMFDNSARAINPENSNIRAGIDATWVGTAADLAVRASVYAMCKRTATVAEKALATGTGTEGAPGTLTYEGSVPFQDIVKIRTGEF